MVELFPFWHQAVGAAGMGASSTPDEQPRPGRGGGFDVITSGGFRTPLTRSHPRRRRERVGGLVRSVTNVRSAGERIVVRVANEVGRAGGPGHAASQAQR